MKRELVANRLWWLAMPWALLLSIVAAVFRSGVTIHVVAVK